MTTYQLQLAGNLKAKYGGVDWDQDQNDSLSYEEIKYKENKDVVELLNFAYSNPSAMNFFKSLPVFKVANLALLSHDEALPLNERYFKEAAKDDKGWLLGVCEAILSSGNEQAWEAADLVLLSATTVHNRDEILTLIRAKEYVKDRTSLSLEVDDPKSSQKVLQKVTREFIKGFSFDPPFREKVRDLLFNSDSPFPVRYVLSGLEPEQRYLFICETAEWVEKGMRSVEYPLSLNGYELKMFNRFLQGWFQDDPQQYYRLYRFALQRNARTAELMILFLEDNQLEQLIAFDPREAKEKACLERELALRQSSLEVLQIISQEDFKKRILQSKRPMIVVFGAKWCPPCQAIQPRLFEWARLYREKAQVGYVHIDEAKELESILNKLAGGRQGIPYFALYQGGRPKHHEGGEINSGFMEKLNKGVQTNK